MITGFIIFFHLIAGKLMRYLTRYSTPSGVGNLFALIPAIQI
jgi:hypothetical protein